MCNGIAFAVLFKCFLILATFSFNLEASVINPPQKLTMNSQNFQHILSWEPGSNTTIPTYYDVMYIENKWKIAKECSNTAHLFCNLTKEYEEHTYTYIAMVQSITGNRVLNSSILEFSPYWSMPCFLLTLPPPPTIQLSCTCHCTASQWDMKIAIVSKFFNQCLITPFRQTGFNKILFSWQIPIKNETSEESFSYVVGSLHSNTNYCVSVAVAASLNHHSIPSALKCIITRSNTQPGITHFKVWSGRESGCQYVVCIFLLGLYKGGFICLKSKPWPKVLSSSQATELLSSDTQNSEEHQSVIRENERISRVFFHPSSEVNSCSTSELSNSACFNINLNSVMLGDPDKTWDHSATLISHQKDAVDLQDSSASDALESKHFTNTVDVKKPDCHNISHEWQDPSVSDESDASDSEYIRR
uniref:Fibronectin type-III domain-containing protein n=1 Tax=Chelonoidis abingdonii TaxID=106734 RepID=A0A8C0J1T1_CHEAB